MGRLTISSRIIIDECQKRGIEAKAMASYPLVELSYKKHKEYLNVYIVSKTSRFAQLVCQHKHLTKEILTNAGISVCQGLVFSKNNIQEAYDFAKENVPIIIKPVNAIGGKNVYKIESLAQFKKIWKKGKFSTKFLAEKFFDGGEYRLLATGEKFLAASRRIPAHVVGDGLHNIKTLIEIKNQTPCGSDAYREAHGMGPRNKILVDSNLRNFLRNKKLSLLTTPTKGQLVYLKDNSNISTGGTSEDCTDIVHESVKEIAKKIVKSIPGLFYGGIDFMTQDITKENTSNDYVILEVNENPGLALHYFPHIGKSRDVVKEIVDLAFPETVGK